MPLLLWASADPTFLLPKDFQKSLTTDVIQGVDIHHQLSRLRHGKNLPDAEVELMMRTFAENLQSYDQVVEVRVGFDGCFLLRFVNPLLPDARICTTTSGRSPSA